MGMQTLTSGYVIAHPLRGEGAATPTRTHPAPSPRGGSCKELSGIALAREWQQILSLFPKGCCRGARVVLKERVCLLRGHCPATNPESPLCPHPGVCFSPWPAEGFWGFQDSPEDGARDTAGAQGEAAV